jgi:SPP1 family predicted phage head-tail adaptor
MKNAGDYNRRIKIVRRTKNTNANGFDTVSETVVCKAWAKASGTRGYTIIQSGSNFEDATVGLEFRAPSVAITRHDVVQFDGKEWSIVYLNDAEATTTGLIELQVRKVEQ